MSKTCDFKDKTCLKEKLGKDTIACKGNKDCLKKVRDDSIIYDKCRGQKNCINKEIRNARGKLDRKALGRQKTNKSGNSYSNCNKMRGNKKKKCFADIAAANKLKSKNKYHPVYGWLRY